MFDDVGHDYRQTIFKAVYTMNWTRRMRQHRLPEGYAHVFLSVGDDGPDQRGLRNSIHTLFAREHTELPMFFFSGLCLKHQFHLAVQSQLRLCDLWLKKLRKKYKYFSSVATLCHTWRGHLAKLRAVWREQHATDIGLGLGKQKAEFNTPPLAIAGRWASIDSILSLPCTCCIKS